MTNEALKNGYKAVFEYWYLISHNGKTLLAGTYKKPQLGSPSFGYSPLLDEIVKIEFEKVVGKIRSYKVVG